MVAGAGSGHTAASDLRGFPTAVEDDDLFQEQAVAAHGKMFQMKVTYEGERQADRPPVVGNQQHRDSDNTVARADDGRLNMTATRSISEREGEEEEHDGDGGGAQDADITPSRKRSQH